MKMKKKPLNRILFCCLILLLITGCSSTSRLSLFNLASLYQKEGLFTSVPALVYHSGDSTSLVIAEINLGNLRYLNIPETDMKAASYRLRYRLLDNYESYNVLDSGSIVSGDTINAGRMVNVLKSFAIKTRYPGKYLMELELTDLNRKERVKNYIQVDRSTSFTRQNYMVIDEENYPVFRNYLSEGEKVKIVCNDPSVSLLTVRCYFRVFPLARPPFSEDRQDVFDYRADSVFTLPVSNGRTIEFELEREGFYHFQSDTSGKEGLTLYRHYSGFPEIKSSAQLVNPLRYITSKEEYERIVKSDDQKDAVDEFWLTTAGNAARARTLIQKYYSNVEESNIFFTSYHEGWKTDRGIVYVIFGRPDYVYRGIDQEDWIYGEPDHRNSLRFNFVRVNNPFTDNDFMLLRSPALKNPWYITVQSWRR